MPKESSADKSTPEDGEQDGAVDYSQRDYQAPTGYRAPDFVSKWAAQDSRGDTQRLADEQREAEREAARDARWDAGQGDADERDADQGVDARPSAPDTSLEDTGLPAPPRTIEELEASIRRDGDAQTPGLLLQGGAPGEELTQDLTLPEARHELLTRIASDSNALLGKRAGDVQRALGAGQRGARVDGASAASAGKSTSAKSGSLTPRTDAQARTRRTDDKATSKGGRGWFAFVVSVLALTFAIASFSFITWVLVIVAIIASIGLVRDGGGRRVVGVITVLITFVAMGVQVSRSGGDSSGGLASNLSGTTSTLDLNGVASASGEGDARLDIVLPGVADPGLLQVEFEGETLRIYDVDNEGEQTGGSVLSSFSDFSGVAVINEWADDDFQGIDIEAEGQWTVTLVSTDTLPAFDSEYSGFGAEIVLYTGPGGDATFAFEPDQSVSIDTFGADSWYEGSREVTALTRPFGAGPTIIRIEPSDETQWSISFGPAPTPTPTR